MLSRSRLVGLVLFLGISALVGPRLFGQTQNPPRPASTVESINDEPRRVSDAERRFHSGQPRHWRQLMIRR